MLRTALQFLRFQIQRFGYTVSPVDRSFFEEQAALASAAAIETVFDVGANVGRTVTQYTARFPKARLVCVEPIPTFAANLRQQFPNATVVEAALADENGRATFHVNQSKDTSSLLRVDANAVPGSYRSIMREQTAISVETVTLDFLCQSVGVARVGLLKLDLQGGELNALRGASGLLEKHDVDVICAEAFLMPFYQDQPLLGDIMCYLGQFGYGLHGLYNPVVSGMTGKWQWLDAIFVAPRLRDASRQLLRLAMTRQNTHHPI